METEESPTTSTLTTGDGVLRKALPIVAVAARRAAELFDIPLVSTLKPDGSLLTAADQEVEDILHSGLEASLPSAYFLGEESTTSESPGHPKMFDHPYVWAVDAVDGTKNFHSGLPIFAVSVGLLEVRDGALEVRGGMVAFPRLDQVFCGWNGKVFREDLSGRNRIEILPAPPVTDPLSSGLMYVQGLKINNDHAKHVRLTGCNAFDIVYAALRGQGTATKGALWDFSGALSIAAALGMHMWEAETGSRKDRFSLSDFNETTWRLKKRHLICRDAHVSALQNLFVPAS